MTDYVKGKLDEFIAEYDGREIDVNGMYGAQSPDLVQAYISRLLGRDWIFPYPFAAHLWADDRGVMTAAGFGRIERDAPLQRGDVLVFDAINGYGTAGIYTGIAAVGTFVRMFTQNPGPAQIVAIKPDGESNRLLGAWRFTAGAECVALAGTYADKLQTRRDHRVIESMKANEWASEQKVGDVVGNTRVIRIERSDEELQPEHWMKRLFLRVTRR